MSVAPPRPLREPGLYVDAAADAGIDISVQERGDGVRGVCERGGAGGAKRKGCVLGRREREKEGTK